MVSSYSTPSDEFQNSSEIVVKEMCVCDGSDIRREGGERFATKVAMTKIWFPR